MIGLRHQDRAAVTAGLEIGDTGQRHARALAAGLFLHAEVLGRGSGGGERALGLGGQIVGVEAEMRVARAAAQIEDGVTVLGRHGRLRPSQRVAAGGGEPLKTGLRGAGRHPI